MTTGMVLDKAFKLYMQNFALMIGLSAILNLPLLAFSLSYRALMLTPGAAGNVTALNLGAALVGLVVLLVSAFIINPLIIGATTRAVSDVYLGKSVTAGTVLSAAWKKTWTLLKTQFFSAVLMLLHRKLVLRSVT